MNEREIRRLRLRFILISTLSFFIVMMIMGGLIWLYAEFTLLSDVDKVMDYIAARDGVVSQGPENNTPPPASPGGMPAAGGLFPSSSRPGNSPGSPSEAGAPAASSQAPAAPPQAPAATDSTQAPADIDSPQTPADTASTQAPAAGDGESIEDIVEFAPSDYFRSGSFSPGTRQFGYSIRYFAVRFSADGSVEDVITHNLGLEDEAAMISYAELARKNPTLFNSIGRFFFRVAERKNGGQLVIYLDRSGEVATTNRVLYAALSLLGLGTLLAFILMKVLSSKVLKPEIENAKKQKEFITNASHELKTPLSVIRANTEMQEIESGETEWTRSTIRQVDRLSGLVQNLVLIARSDERESKEKRARFDASKAAGETVEAFRSLAAGEEKELTADIAPGITLNASETKFRQLLTLLTDNAVKYCDAKGHIRVRLELHNRSLRMMVSNSYAAGENVDFRRFFERFYREDSAHSDKGGYGIGLSVAESLAKQLGGSLIVRWKDGDICFIFRIRGREQAHRRR